MDCPECGGENTKTQENEIVVFGKCLDCGCEFQEPRPQPQFETDEDE